MAGRERLIGLTTVALLLAARLALGPFWKDVVFGYAEQLRDRVGAWWA